MKKAYLILKDGKILEATSIGAEKTAVGEVVFNTSMAGYQEAITDPSYAGQILTFTYPLIGNYGTCANDYEAHKPHLKGVILREMETVPSNYASQETLHNFFLKHEIVAICDIDTRQLTKHIRNYGVLPGAIVVADRLTEDMTVEIMKQIEAFTDKEVIQEVSCKTSYRFEPQDSDEKMPHVVVMDFGAKTNILKCLKQIGCRITVVPFDTDFTAIKELAPAAVFLSNGPGDPKSIPSSIKTIEQLAHNYPVMGICLGHQLLALAFGGDTYKLKFGHRGGNHPVQDLRTKRVYITSQNHGYAVDADSLDKTGFLLTHINLNDHTVEGMKHKTLPIFSVQYHPEANPGPEDSRYLFDKFAQMLKLTN